MSRRACPQARGNSRVCGSLCTKERNRVVSAQIRVPGQLRPGRELRRRGMDFLAPHRSRSSHRRRPSLLVLALLAAVVVAAMFAARNRRRPADGRRAAAGPAPVPPDSSTFAGERSPSAGAVPPLGRTRSGERYLIMRSRRRAIAQRRHADLAAAGPPEPADPPALRPGSPAGPPALRAGSQAGPLASRAGSPAGPAPAGRAAQSGNGRRRLWGLSTLLIGASIATCAALALANPDSSFALSKP